MKKKLQNVEKITALFVLKIAKISEYPCSLWGIYQPTEPSIILEECEKIQWN